MSILNEAIQDELKEEAAVNISENIEESAQEKLSLNMPDLSFLRIKTGDGTIDDYIDHPLNNSRSRGLAQVLRGVSGIFGQLDLALIDILVGALNMTKEKKTAAPKTQEFIDPRAEINSLYQ